MSQSTNNEKWAKAFIWIISIVVIGLVTMLYTVKKTAYQPSFDVTIFPKINAILNSLVSILLLMGLVFIKQNKIEAHRKAMLSAFSLSGLFLVVYVIYHALAESTSYGGERAIKYVYYFILLTHVLLAALSFPFILMVAYQALTRKFDKHKKLARFVWPVWFYVAVTGVLVYLFISPYY